MAQVPASPLWNHALLRELKSPDAAPLRLLGQMHPMYSSIGQDLKEDLLIRLAYFVLCCDALLVALLERISGVALDNLRPLSSPSLYTEAGFKYPKLPFPEIDGLSASQGVYRLLLSRTRMWLDGLENAPEDPLQDLYRSLMPRSLKRLLGEFPTPPWLAEVVLSEGLALGKKPRVIVDASCGTGVFISHAMARLPDAEVLGLDLNPIFVMAAYANFVLAGYKRGTRPNTRAAPVFVADTLADPLENIARKVNGIVGSSDPQAADLVVGNPPWINRAGLDPRYRVRVDQEFRRYDLLPASTPIGSAKADVAGLFVYRVADGLAKDGAVIALLLPQPLFKSEAAAKFRLLRLPDGTPLGALVFHDMHRLQPFPGAATRTSLCIFRKGTPVKYPVRTFMWDGNCAHSTKSSGFASPIDGTPTGPWAVTHTWPPKRARQRTELRGQLEFEEFFPKQSSHAVLLREGVNTGGASGIFWVDILKVAPDGRVLIRNRSFEGRLPMPSIGPCWVERTMVYPLLRARDVKAWARSYKHYIVVPHTESSGMHPLTSEELRHHFPGTADFLNRARSVLENRRALLYRWGGALRKGWYRLFEVGPYTFAPIKVVVKGQVATKLEAAVVEPTDDHNLGRTIVIPDQTLYFIPCKDPGEAKFYAAVLNSRALGDTYQALGYKHITRRTFRVLPFATYDSENKYHQEIAQLVAQLSTHDADTGLKDEIESLVRLCLGL